MWLLYRGHSRGCSLWGQRSGGSSGCWTSGETRSIKAMVMSIKSTTIWTRGTRIWYTYCSCWWWWRRYLFRLKNSWKYCFFVKSEYIYIFKKSIFYYTLKWLPSRSPWWGILMFRGFIDIFGGEGISSLSALSDSSIRDWKNSRILVLGNLMEHLGKYIGIFFRFIKILY